MRKNSVKIFSGFILCFLIFQLIGINQIGAEVVSIWGVSEGATRSYDYNIIYTGSISSTESYPRRTYTVARIFDQDGNNYTELLLEIETTSTYGLPDTSTTILDDASSSWTNGGLRPTPANFYTFNPLYPTYYNASDNIGFNWTKALVDYNTNINNWNMTIEANIATINQSSSGTESGADYNLTILIMWDTSTGWLVSYSYLKEYNETLGYSVHYQTIIYTPEGFVLDMASLLSIIAIAVGAVAILFAFLAYRKLKGSPDVKIY